MKHEGKTPSETDRLTIDVIGITRTSMQSVTRVVGIGSIDHKIYTEMSKQVDVPRPRKQGQSHGAQHAYQEGSHWLYSGVHAKGTQRV